MVFHYFQLQDEKAAISTVQHISALFMDYVAEKPWWQIKIQGFISFIKLKGTRSAMRNGTVPDY